MADIAHECALIVDRLLQEYRRALSGLRDRRISAAVLEGGQLSSWKGLDVLEQEYALGSVVADASGHGSAWEACLKTFLAAIRQDTLPPQNLFDALHITAIGWAANESLRSGRPARVAQFD